MTFFICVSPRQGHVECARARPCGGRRSRRSARERAGARGRTRRRAGQGGAASSWPGLCEVAELLGRAPMTPDRKSTRLTPVTNAHLVCRILLEILETGVPTDLHRQHIF